MTAIVGASGAGKTTLVDLIPRFYDPTLGRILVDGVDLRAFDINSIRRRLAVVSQDTFIFNTSIRANIAYGSEDASEAEILEVARLANALEFILEMPDGLDTQMGDRGVRLSRWATPANCDRPCPVAQPGNSDSGRGNQCLRFRVGAINPGIPGNIGGRSNRNCDRPSVVYDRAGRQSCGHGTGANCRTGNLSRITGTAWQTLEISPDAA
nr:ATP-binding cassette domain-containing protein [Kovacikia minuta]